MDRLKLLLPFALLLILAGAVTWRLFPSTDPYGGLALPLNEEQIVSRSRQFLEQSGVDLSTLTSRATLRVDRPLLRQAQRTLGFPEANRLIRDSIPAYFWQVRWTKAEGMSFSFGEDENSDKRAQQAINAALGEFTLRMDPQGNVIGYERSIPDSAALPTLSKADARRFALSILRTSTPFLRVIADTNNAESEKIVKQLHREDYEFVWKGASPLLHNPIHVKVTVAGSVVSAIDPSVEIPEQFRQSDTVKFLSILLILAYTVLGVGLLFIAYRRIRSYEIGFRTAITLGIVTGILFDLQLYFSITDPFRWELLIPLLITPLFVGGALALIWAVAESLVRELWSDKFSAIDLITNGHLLHSRLGQSTIRGLAFGTTALAVSLLLTSIAGHFLTLSAAGEESFSLFTGSPTSLFALGESFSNSIFPFAFFVVFGVTFLRQWITRTPLLVAAGAVLMAILNTGPLTPVPAAMVIQTLVYAFIVWSFVRYDALTTFVAFLTWHALRDAGGLLMSGHPAYAGAGIIVLSALGVLLVLSVATQFRRKEITDFSAITPAFARHITERQRLQQELEIAREVQMSFLPKKHPTRYRLDIAARCAPAQEVGGDYYDFIELDEHRLGVAIGDVSGKGTQAAFFMTLTKGFLRALAAQASSPAAVLTHANRLFYENVERGMFISMVYGIFDMSTRTLTLARAGHNPVIVRKSSATQPQVLQPTGLALGLDGGDTFGRSIEDIRVDFQPGDVFVLYTDGFSEAMNKKMEEFGEDRLAQAVQSLAGGTATQIMDGVFRAIKTFVGGAQQHDDMSIIVVKVL